MISEHLKMLPSTYILLFIIRWISSLPMDVLTGADNNISLSLDFIWARETSQ